MSKDTAGGFSHARLRPSERSSERLNEQSIERSIERATARSIERLRGRLSDRSSGRAIYRARDRATEQATERSIERSTERSSEATERVIKRSERTNEPASERPNHTITRSAEVRFIRCLMRWIGLFKTSRSSILMMFKSIQIRSFFTPSKLSKTENVDCQVFLRPQGPTQIANRVSVKWLPMFFRKIIS